MKTLAVFNSNDPLLYLFDDENSKDYYDTETNLTLYDVEYDTNGLFIGSRISKDFNQYKHVDSTYALYNGNHVIDENIKFDKVKIQIKKSNDPNNLNKFNVYFDYYSKIDKEIISKDVIKEIDLRVEKILEKCAKFKDEYSEFEFKKLARFWLFVPSLLEKYDIVYEDFYNIGLNDVYIEADGDSEDSFALLKLKSGNNKCTVIEPDAFKFNYDDENEPFKMEMRKVDIDYFKENIKLYEKTSNIDNIIDELDAIACK